MSAALTKAEALAALEAAIERTRTAADIRRAIADDLERAQEASHAAHETEQDAYNAVHAAQDDLLRAIRAEQNGGSK